MSNIISDILEIEKAADVVIEKSLKQAGELQQKAESELQKNKSEAEQKIRAAEDEENKKCLELIKSESERIEKQTELKTEKIKDYYSKNKERILTELFDKALKA